MRENPECKKNDLKTYLIMPVQRIPRYELLLRELIRKTPPGHPDSVLLKEAFSKIKAISELIDHRKDDNVKFQEVVRVHSMLDPRVPHLITPTRRFIAEFSLVQHGGSYKGRGKHIMCFIFNDLLILGRAIEEKKTLRPRSNSNLLSPTQYQKYHPREVWNMSDVNCSLTKEFIVLTNTPTPRPDDPHQQQHHHHHANSAGEESEYILGVSEGAPGGMLLEMMKLISKAKLARESSSNHLTLRRNSSEPSHVMGAPEITPRESQESVHVAVGMVNVVKTDDEIEEMAEKTKADTVGVLHDMVKEAEKDWKDCSEELKQMDEGEEKEKKKKEANALEQKLQGLQFAMLSQNKKETPRNVIQHRQRSNTEPFSFRKFNNNNIITSNNSNASGTTSTNSSPTANKRTSGLFGSIRKKSVKKMDVKDE